VPLCHPGQSSPCFPRASPHQNCISAPRRQHNDLHRSASRCNYPSFFTSLPSDFDGAERGPIYLGNLISRSADHPTVPRPIGIDSHSTLCTSMPTMRKMPSLSAEPCSGVFRNVCDRRLDPNERSESSHSAYLHARTHARTSMHPQTHARAHMHVHTCTLTRTHGRTRTCTHLHARTGPHSHAGTHTRHSLSSARTNSFSHSAVVCGRESLTHPHHRQ
jgi:hypothetical protein